MALLVQPHLGARLGGVMTTRAPGRPNCLEVAVSGTGPQGVVDGEDAAMWWVDRRTAAVSSRTGRGATDTPSTELPGDLVSGLIEASATCEGLFGGPQQIEWLHDGEGLWILQSRPAG